MRHPLARFLALLLLLAGLLEAVPPLPAAGCPMPCCKRSGRGPCCPREAAAPDSAATPTGCRMSACAQPFREATLWRDSQPGVFRPAVSGEAASTALLVPAPAPARLLSRPSAPPAPPPRNLPA